MPRALAIETSSRVGSLALVEDGHVLAEAEFPHGLAHAAGIVLMIDDLCRRQSWGPADLALVYVSAGPGSFTGLRIGVTVAKTLAFGLGAKLVAVPSMRVLAENAPPEAQEVLVALDARRGQIYAARFDRQERGSPWREVEAAHVDTLADALGRAGRPVHLLGDAVAAYRTATEPIDGVIVASESLSHPRASVVGRLGWAMARDGQWADPYRLKPIYLRPPEAEEKLVASV